jgi:DNA primase
MFALQPDGLDPCDLRLAHGDAAIRDLVAQRVPVYELAIRSELARHNLDTNEGRLAALDAAASIVGRIKDYGLRDRYAVSLDRWLGMMDENFVLARVRERLAAVTGPRRPGARGNNSGSGNSNSSARNGQNGHGPGPTGQPKPGGPGTEQDPVRPAMPPYNADNPVVQLEREALKLAVQRPALCGPSFDALGRECFTVPVHAAVFGLITDCGGAGGGAAGGREWAERLLAAAPDEQLEKFLTRLAVEQLHTPRADGEADARYIDAILARVEELAVSREIAVLKSRLQRLSPVQETNYNKIFGDLVGLEQRRKVLSDRAAGAL